LDNASENPQVLSNNEGETIGRVLEISLIERGVDSIFTIIVDNASSNDVCIDYMRRWVNNKNSIVLGGKL